jgi:hypothetical protein
VACDQATTLDVYDQAIAAVESMGLKVQLTFLWYGQTDAGVIASWMGQMAAHFAPVVKRFSVLNEPDLTLPASDDCDPQTISQMVSSGVLKTSTRMYRIKRYLWRRVKIRRHGKIRIVRQKVYWYKWVHYKFWRGYRYKRIKIRAYRWVDKPTETVQESSDYTQQNVLTVKQGCIKVQRGRIYHRIFVAAEPAIRSAAPGSQVLAGETSPVDGLDLFIPQALPLNADGWAHHCYQWDLTPATGTGGFGVGDTQRVAQLVGMPLYYTECGYPNPDSAWNQERWGGLFTHDNLPAAYIQMWQFSRDQGVREMSQLGWCKPVSGTWDTSLMLGPDCSPSLEYLALQKLITSWGS